MERLPEHLRFQDNNSAEQAFDAWFTRTLRTMYEPVMHESLPEDIVAILRELPPQH